MNILPTQSKNMGFTLAEVLITLAVIGVIAALTIPGLINNMQQSEYNEGVKVAYSVLSQAITSIQANDSMLHVGNGSNTAFRDDFCNVLNCIKKDTNTNITNNIPYLLYKDNNPADGFQFTDGTPGAILNNGMYLIQFWNWGSCSNWGINACGSVTVDVNGAKKPNMFGVDMFTFEVVRNNGAYLIIPDGTPNDNNTGPSSSSDQNCAIGNYATGCTYNRLTNPNNMP